MTILKFLYIEGLFQLLITHSKSKVNITS